MKSIFIFLLITTSFLLSACGEARSIGIIGGVDGPTSVFVSENKEKEADKWGISLHADNICPTGLTLEIKQYGGSPSGKLQTGSAYSLEKNIDGKWQPVKAKVDNPVWNSIAYSIIENDISRLKINWEFLYGELPTGLYCISKEVMDFRKAGDFDEETYRLYFEIE